MDYDRETLAKFRLSQLYAIATQFKFDISNTSQLLVHYLVNKDERIRRLTEREERVTAILIQYASENGLDINIKFNVSLPDGRNSTAYKKWENAWVIISRIRRGIPKLLRKRVWDSVATHYTRRISFEYPILFHSKKNARDLLWLEKMSKTAYELKSKYVSHTSIEHVLLAYSRHNTCAEYTPELCILSSLILKVVEGEEESALKVLVCLMDHKLPAAYFTQKLCSIHLDIIVLNDLLVHLFPQLACHLKQLQTANSSKICKSYSSSNPPSFKDSTSYEPPLINAFVLQWFLYMFTLCLPWKALRRLFDAVVVCGADMFVYAALAVWGIFERDLLSVDNVPDYYMKVEELEEKLKSSRLLSSTDFMQMVYSVADIAQSSTDIPSIDELRHIHSPLTPPPLVVQIPCPLPAQGGAFLIQGAKVNRSSFEVNVGQPVLAAKAECPQTIRNKFLFANAYAADVPNGVLAQYSMNITQSHFQLLKEGKHFFIDM